MGTGRRLSAQAVSCGHPGARHYVEIVNCVGLVKRVVEVSSEDEIKPIDWLVPVS